MPVFVFYNDDYWEMGGVGLETFVSQEDAARFIAERMKSTSRSNVTLENYTAIEGDRLVPKVAQTVTKIVFE